MLKVLFRRLSVAVSGESPDADLDHDEAIRLATAVLLVDVARADHSFGEDETRLLLELVARRFGLTEIEAEQLAWDAELRADEMVSLHELVSLLNQHLDDGDKAGIVDLLWQIAYADGRLHRYESSLVLKISDLLYVNRAAVMRLKHDAGERSRRDPVGN